LAAEFLGVLKEELSRQSTRFHNPLPYTLHVCTF